MTVDNWHYQQWLEETRQKVQVGLDELDRGEGLDSEVVIERLREKLRNARESASQPQAIPDSVFNF